MKTEIPIKLECHAIGKISSLKKFIDSYFSKSFIIELLFWASFSLILWIGFIQDIEFKWAIFRAITLTLIWFSVHHFQILIRNKFYHKGQVIKFYLGILLLISSFTILRLFIEISIFPKEALPNVFKNIPFRPFFYLGYTVLIVCLSTLVSYALELKNKEIELRTLIGKHNQSRLLQLQSQINPHFLFNSLNNIYSFALTNASLTPQLILKLTEILRYSVYQNSNKYVLISDEAKQIEYMIELFALRNDLPYNIKTDISINGGKIIPMVLIPLVENSLKHCDFDLNKSAFLKIELHSDENKIRFTTKNTFSPSQIKSNAGGVGLRNIQERLEIIYGDKFILEATENNGIFKVSLELPCKN